MPLTPDHLFRALVDLDDEAPAGRAPHERLVRLLDRLGRPANDAGPAPPPPAPPAGPAPAKDAHAPPPPAASPDDLLDRLADARAAAPDPARSAALYQRLRDLVREHDELTRRYHADFDRLFDPSRVDPQRAGLLPAEGDDEDERLLARLRAAQVILLKYPIAAQALIAALIAEGRRFAATPEGARWKESLAGSDLLRRGRAVWEAATLRAFDADPERPLPTTYLEAFARACQRGDLEPLLARLFTDGPGDAR